MMTLKEELTKTRAEIDGLVKEHNEGVDTKSNKEIAKIRADIDDRLATYLNVAERDCFAELKEKENPLAEAVKIFSYDTIKVKEVKSKNSVTVTLEVIENTKDIDILKLYKFINNDATPEWEYAIEHLNLLFAARVAKDINAKNTDGKVIDIETLHNSFAMDRIARAIEIENDQNGSPVSNTQLLKALNKVVAAVLGKSKKAKSQDIAWLCFVYAKESSKNINSVKVRNNVAFRRVVTRVLHRIETDTFWGLEYPELKR